MKRSIQNDVCQIGPLDKRLAIIAQHGKVFDFKYLVLTQFHQHGDGWECRPHLGNSFL